MADTVEYVESISTQRSDVLRERHGSHGCALIFVTKYGQKEEMYAYYLLQMKCHVIADVHGGGLFD